MLWEVKLFTVAQLLASFSEANEVKDPAPISNV